MRHFRLPGASGVANKGKFRGFAYFLVNYKAFLASMRSLVFRGVASLWARC